MSEVLLKFGQFLLSATEASWSAYTQSWWKELTTNPAHVFIETILILFVIYILVVQRSYNPRIPVEVLTKQEEDELIQEWTPNPLVDPAFDEQTAIDNQAIGDIVVTKERKNGYEVETMEHGTLIDFSSYDFYGMNRNKRIEKTLRETLDGYGVGSCGPRGFYGTIDTHLHLEKALADFAQVDDAIIFSDNSSTIASVIPAFAKRGDLLMVDAGVCSSVYTGCKLSRARIITFKHQDYEDLREQLLKVEKEDKHRGTSPAKQRRFIVTEGISRNFGTLLDLPKVLSLKNEFGFRLIVDETISFGVLGKNGRGVTEHFGLPIDSIDLLTGSLETSFASVGGFCVGSQAIVDHQRLSAAGYVFSASAPAYTSTVAQEALAMLQEGNGQYEADLANRIESFHASFRKQLGGSGKKRSPLTIISDVVSPIVHIGFRTDESNRNIPSSLLKAGYTEIFSDREQQHKFLCHLREYLLNNGGFLCNVPVFARGTIVTVPQPSLRLTLRLTQPSTFQTRLLMKIKEFCSRCPVA